MATYYTLYKITALEGGTIRGLQTLFTGRLNACYDHADKMGYGNDTRIILSKRSYEDLIDRPWFSLLAKVAT
jgi:hypothetical protein